MIEDEDEARRFLEMVFGPMGDGSPAVERNADCKFTERVLNYLFLEWEVELTDYHPDVQNRAIDVIDMMRARGSNVPTAAAKIAVEVLPL